MIAIFFGRNKTNSFCLVLCIVLFFSCNSSNLGVEIEVPIETSEEKVIKYISTLLDNRTLETMPINEQIDSIQISGEIAVQDSVNKTIYMGITPTTENEVYQSLEQFFSKQFGQVQCDTTFCSWTIQPSKKKRVEVLLMDETIEKQHPFIALEIEEIHER